MLKSFHDQVFDVEAGAGRGDGSATGDGKAGLGSADDKALRDHDLVRACYMHITHAPFCRSEGRPACRGITLIRYTADTIEYHQLE